ncbi:MAG: 2-dehydropantoate 2-reductase N-terminal domain-containing protein [Acetobacteraceae bacterium]|nr:2-dehydropantoate 2-reductase N-terminal domain-containing protein [Acetobacteraceae bacterium]
MSSPITSRPAEADGLEISGPVETFRQVVPALTPEKVDGVWPVAVLAVKSQATAQAVAQLAPFVAEDGFVLSAQNGLNELIIAEALGEHRTIRGIRQLRGRLARARAHPVRQPRNGRRGRDRWDHSRAYGCDAPAA